MPFSILLVFPRDKDLKVPDSRYPKIITLRENKEMLCVLYVTAYNLSRVLIYCVVPENIHTPTTEGHGNSKG